ncbi:MAG: amidohydrolase family protein [Spirochaetota bacterium]|nr:MAG: amidohydrolase family protein [Spirochaetota bacterium]
MQFQLDNPLDGLHALPHDIWDAHIHIWDIAAFSEFEKWAEIYGVQKYTGIATPDVKRTLEQRDKADKFLFAYYLPIDAFARHDTQKLLTAVKEAKEYNYAMVKMWFGPRFLDFSNANKPFAISHPDFDPVYSFIEDNGLPIDIHVADPDIWYTQKYLDVKRYRTKRKAIDEFCTVLEHHPRLKVISVHFGSLPEPENIPLLSSLLDNYSNMYIDTASTKWIVRELGRNTHEARNFIIKYQKRILFASDIDLGWGNKTEDYYATRYWAQRLFWETDVTNVALPFTDEDNDKGSTKINGLHLPTSVLKNLYWRNALHFFSN